MVQKSTRTGCDADIIATFKQTAISTHQNKRFSFQNLQLKMYKNEITSMFL